MTFVNTIPEADADGAVAELYETDRATFGHLPNFTAAFSLHPAVYRAWRQLNGAIKADMDLRRYELATLAAARRLRSSYCALAHGSIVADATSVTQADVDRLRGLGLPDSEISGIVLAAAARSFFSKTLDGLGVAPDAKYAGLDPALRDALTVGRAISEA
jgi:alkylhydroperoxidase family enzyme